ncbi:hypothetical protein D3C80_1366230 [compost metagenome]
MKTSRFFETTPVVTEYMLAANTKLDELTFCEIANSTINGSIGSAKFSPTLASQ